MLRAVARLLVECEAPEEHVFNIWWFLVCIFLVMVSGICSGLTLVRASRPVWLPRAGRAVHAPGTPSDQLQKLPTLSLMRPWWLYASCWDHAPTPRLHGFCLHGD